MKIDTLLQKVWITSDTHYGHVNICKGTSKWTDLSGTRDFDTLDDMNTHIVDQLNAYVDEHDVLFHLGDWSFGGFSKIEEFRQRIKCKTIHLILGNHDQHIRTDKGGCKSLFTSVSPYMDVTFITPSGNIPVSMLHYPMASWNNLSRGGLHFHGHVHLTPDRIISGGRRIDVGVDGNYFKPHLVQDIVKKLLKLPIYSDIEEDHHVL